MEILEYWNDKNIAIDVKESMEYLVLYLEDIKQDNQQIPKNQKENFKDIKPT